MKPYWKRVKSHPDSIFYHYELDVDLMKEMDIEMYNFMESKFECTLENEITTNADENTINEWRKEAEENGFYFKKI